MAKKYYPRAYKRLLLQERDLQIMNYCLEQKFLTIEQVSRRFFRPGEQVKNKLKKAYERVLVLQKFGLLELVPLLLGQKVVQTTELGAREIENKGYDALPAAPVDYRTYEHDCRVSDVRLILEELKLITSWTSERHLKKKYVGRRRVPDALFKLITLNNVALEVEIARKGKPRYEKIFDEYCSQSLGDIDMVIYLCNSEEQRSYLLDIATSYNNKWYGQILFGLYDELVQKRMDTKLISHDDYLYFEEIPYFAECIQEELEDSEEATEIQ